MEPSINILHNLSKISNDDFKKSDIYVELTKIWYHFAMQKQNQNQRHAES